MWRQWMVHVNQCKAEVCGSSGTQRLFVTALAMAGGFHWKEYRGRRGSTSAAWGMAAVSMIASHGLNLPVETSKKLLYTVAPLPEGSISPLRVAWPGGMSSSPVYFSPDGPWYAADRLSVKLSSSCLMTCSGSARQPVSYAT